ncbi:MerR family transcriptional regulator [Enterococcus sp. LJL98]
MEYSIKEMSTLSGVSRRTLRYYDTIGLLPPKRTTDSGYRLYGEEEVNRLQQILLYKRMGLKLEEIRAILTSEAFDVKKALEAHHQVLLEQQKTLRAIIETVEQTIESMKGRKHMTDQEKFKGLRQQQLQMNEEKYGKEIRKKYGEEKVKQANENYLGLSEMEVAEMERTEVELIEKLQKLQETAEIESPLAKEIFELHKHWLQFSWTEYHPEAHKGLGFTYIGDDRFTHYYEERAGQGAAQLLHEIIQYYA